MTITLCLLTWNEIDGCKHDIPQIKRSQFDDIFAIDGGSVDGTVEYLKHEKIKVIKQNKKGLNAAHIQAVESCKTDAIIFFHPKGTISVANTLKFRKFFDSGYELVIGSRIIKGSQNEEDESLFKPRKWLTILLAITASIVWKRDDNTVWDVLHGFRGITIKAFGKFNPPTSGLTIDIAGVVQSYKKDIKRIEFPVKERSRTNGSTHFKAIPTGLEILRYLIKQLFLIINPFFAN